jgi:hypothetical protein
MFTLSSTSLRTLKGRSFTNYRRCLHPLLLRPSLYLLITQGGYPVVLVTDDAPQKAHDLGSRTIP